MTTKVLRAALPNALICRGGDAFTLAITRDADVQWRLRMRAHLAHGARDFGVIYTQPFRMSGATQTRVIASGCLPGAIAWEVDGECINRVGVRNDIELDLTVATGCQLPNFLDLEYRTINYQAGAAGLVTFYPWQRLKSYTARAGAGPANISLNGRPPIGMPPGITIAVDGLQQWGGSIELIGTDAYVLEVEGL